MNLRNKHVFEDKVDGLFNELYNSLKPRRESVKTVSAKAMEFRQTHFIRQKTLLVPPKRRLEGQIPIDMSALPGDDGSGVTNRLFYLKNQPLNSDDFNRYQKIDKAFTEVAHGWMFNVFPGTDNQLTVHFKSDSDTDWRGSDICGLGLSDVLVIITLILASDHELFLIEEPESHVHPDMQRRLLKFIKAQQEKQFIISTHSNVFLDNAYVDKVYLCKNEKQIMIEDSTSKASALDDMGYSIVDNLVSDLVILVEGPTDVSILETYLKKLGIDGSANVRFWPLGGDIMDQLDISLLLENRKCIAIIDGDRKSQKIRNRFEEKCKEYKIPCHQLKRYAIENYFTLRALRVVFKGQIKPEFTEIDPMMKLMNQIGIDVKGNNRKLAEAMTFEEIRDTEDLYEFLESVKELLK